MALKDLGIAQACMQPGTEPHEMRRESETMQLDEDSQLQECGGFRPPHYCSL